MNPNIENMWQFQQEVQQVCKVYEDAMKLAEQGIHILSMDEKIGIQAIAHDHPSKPMKPGHVDRMEHNYTRHGTTGLITSRDIVSRKLIALSSSRLARKKILSNT